MSLERGPVCRFCLAPLTGERLTAALKLEQGVRCTACDDLEDRYLKAYPDDELPLPLWLGYFARNGYRLGDEAGRLLRAEVAKPKPLPPAPAEPNPRDPSRFEEREREPAPPVVFCRKHGVIHNPPVDHGEETAGTIAAEPPLPELTEAELDAALGYRYNTQSTTEPPAGPAARQQEEAKMETNVSPSATPAVASPFLPALAIPKRLKGFFYGPPGAGKTIMSLQFPGVALIDLERGTDHYGGKFQFAKLPTASLAEINKAILWLLTVDHQYRTLVVDPITIYWDMIQTKWADYFGRKATKKGESPEVYQFEPKDWKPMKDEFKEFLRLLSQLDMNVICTAHEKDLYSDSEFMKKVGQTYDCEKHAAHFFDTVGRIYVTLSGERVIRIQKDRTNRLPMNKEFPATYAEFEKCLGTEDLGRKATADPFASAAPAPAPASASSASTASAPADGNGGGFIPATDAQLGFLKRLLAQKNSTFEDFMQSEGLCDNEGKPKLLSKKECSDLLDALNGKKSAAVAS